MVICNLVYFEVINESKCFGFTWPFWGVFLVLLLGGGLICMARASIVQAVCSRVRAFSESVDSS